MPHTPTSEIQTEDADSIGTVTASQFTLAIKAVVVAVGQGDGAATRHNGHAVAQQPLLCKQNARAAWASEQLVRRHKGKVRPSARRVRA